MCSFREGGPIRRGLLGNFQETSRVEQRLLGCSDQQQVLSFRSYVGGEEAFWAVLGAPWVRLFFGARPTALGVLHNSG